MSATRKWARLRALTPLERRVLGEALVLLPAASAGLKVAGMRRTREALALVARKGKSAGGLEAASIARLVAIAARHGPFRGRCLSASIALESLLRRYGVDGRLRLGIRRHDGRIEAHAWVEHRGEALNETHSTFEPFDTAAEVRS